MKGSRRRRRDKRPEKRSASLQTIDYHVQHRIDPLWLSMHVETSLESRNRIEKKKTKKGVVELERRAGLLASR